MSNSSTNSNSGNSKPSSPDEKIISKNIQNLNNLTDFQLLNMKKKPFIERAGDWNCFKCKNLNFSFRVTCNRCQMTKKESEKLYDSMMKNMGSKNETNKVLISNNINLFNSCKFDNLGLRNSTVEQ